MSYLRQKRSKIYEVLYHTFDSPRYFSGKFTWPVYWRNGFPLSIVEVTTKDGKMLSARHDLPKGEPEFACSEADMLSKFMSLAGDAKTTEECQKIAELIMNLENTSDVNKITRLL